eukprot:TRINITY_DN4240_c0_g1_i1.p1 TRINITY_DN4240_c0_g1~~TRINITY_DN4240_c0_g1_i1.p1  ORF type:complete len:405 (-),score=50.54 TRINITY_DN4240_c0_g1_i1:44-1258(-)
MCAYRYHDIILCYPCNLPSLNPTLVPAPLPPPDWLPVTPSAHSAHAPLAMGVGGTPFFEVTNRLGNGMPRLYLKDETRNPTGSLKDRASALVVEYAKSRGIAVITTASTGNAGVALSGMAAAAGIRTVVFVPASCPAAKVAQLRVYGANVVLVQGSYDDACALCIAAADKNGWLCRNTAYNPLTSEGKKTVGMEIAAQFDSIANSDTTADILRVPDVVMVSVGDGNIITGVYKGFRDLHRAGKTTKMPRIIGVQSEGSDACTRAWESNKSASELPSLPGISSNTRADSLSVDLPADRTNAVLAVQETKGAFVRVTDDAIIAAIQQLASATGVFAEPAAASVVAGLHEAKRQGMLNGAEHVALIITGSGLKDVPAAIQSCGVSPASQPPLQVQPGDLEGLSSLSC